MIFALTCPFMGEVLEFKTCHDRGHPKRFIHSPQPSIAAGSWVAPSPPSLALTALTLTAEDISASVSRGADSSLSGQRCCESYPTWPSEILLTKMLFSCFLVFSPCKTIKPYKAHIFPWHFHTFTMLSYPSQNTKPLSSISGQIWPENMWWNISHHSHGKGIFPKVWAILLIYGWY